MAFTGTDFQFAFERRVDKMFNDYYDVQTSRDFYRRVLRLGLIEKFEALDKQRRYDELRSFIVLNKQLPALVNSLTTNRILLQDLNVVSYSQTLDSLGTAISAIVTTSLPNNVVENDFINIQLEDTVGGSLIGSFLVTLVPNSNSFQINNPPAFGTFLSGFVRNNNTAVNDYLRLNSIKVRYKKKSDIQIAAFNVVPSKVEFVVDSYCKLRTNDFVSISGVQGTTSANGDWYLKQTAPKKYQIFEDKTLTTPVLGNSKYLSGGNLFEFIVTEPIFQEKPDQITVIDKPTYDFPRWSMSQGSIIIEPAAYLDQAYISYLSIPPFEIDPENNNLDLLLFMPQELIEFLVDYAAKLFDLETKDWNSLNFDNSQVITNK
jgi:hypothetical protein